jgi:hypothetical protein
MSEMDPKALAADAVRAYQEGNFENAARLFGEAASAFSAAENALEAAEMKNNQSVAFLQARNAKAAFEAARGTASVFANAMDARREGMAFGNEAAALQALARANEAYETFRLAAEAFQRAGEDQLRAAVMQAMAGIELKQGKFMQALLTMQLGLAGVKQPTFKQKVLLFLLRFRP